MKFTLTYDGELGSPRPQKIWDIRLQLHPQLEELWRVDPRLRAVERQRHWPRGTSFQMEVHHSETLRTPPAVPPENSIDLCASIECGGYQFRPLVRESYLLRCSLKILFLRKEEPGHGLPQGDIDNRLNTLFDALSMPRHPDQVIRNQVPPDPIFTLMEDDSMVTDVQVETRRLLTGPGGKQTDARLLIEADVRVTEFAHYNQAFLGG